ncbi:MAG: cytochrome c-type biogenesis protein CcmE [Thiomicrorhabdus sp.]|nr:MAG: cytochrome c-type biogenesis protein CcmE [Thiomicrorhabdus sp.]
MKPRMQKLLLIGAGLVAIGIAVTLVLNAFQENLVFFHTPTEVKEHRVPYDRTIRIGGMVEKGSFVRDEKTTDSEFKVTDNESTILVNYTGILPDLFREGQGVVAEGKLSTSGKFVASRVFAKHDETYMPPEAAEAMKRAEDKAKAAASTVITESNEKGN